MTRLVKSSKILRYAHKIHTCFRYGLGTNNNYLPVQNYLISFYDRYGVCLLRGTS
jgi:hypothetical protein